MRKEEIVQLLRDRFRRGATPSKLIRIIVEMHPGKIPNPSVIQDYLEAAFHIPLIPCLKSGDDYSADHTLRHSVLNRVLLPELLAYFQTGSNQAEGQDAVHGSWLDGLTTISSDEAMTTEQAKPNHGISDEGWSRLDEADQDSILGMIASSHVVSCRMQILAKLAECLQHQIDELEAAAIEQTREAGKPTVS